MKKKLLATLLSLSMVASMLSGCGKENTTTESATEIQQVETEVSGEENVQEAENSEEANTEDLQESESTLDAQNTENTEEISTKQEDKNYTAEDIANAIDPEHFGVEVDQDGFKIKMFVSGKDVMMNYGLFVPSEKMSALTESEDASYDMDQINANGGLLLEFTMYSVDGEVYCCTNIGGTNKYTKIPANEDTQDLFEAPTEEKGVNPENIKDVNYLETKTYDGIVVDVVEFTADEGNSSLFAGNLLGGKNSSSDDEEQKACMYIDAETGKAVAIAVNEGDKELIINIYEADVELPSEYADAEEGRYDELVGQLMAFLFLPLSLGSDDGNGTIDEDNFKIEDEDLEFYFEDDDNEDEDFDFDFDFDDEVDE